MLGFVKPTRGDIETSFSFRNRFKFVSYLPEENIFPDFLTGQEFLYYFYKIKTGNNLENKKVDFIDRYLHIKKLFNKEIKKFSKGMKRKIGIANALLSQTELTILDEPFEGLDPGSQIELIKLIKELNLKSNCTFFISSHILSNLEELCTRIIYIKNGKIIFDKSMNEIDKQKIKLKNLFEEGLT